MDIRNHIISTYNEVLSYTDAELQVEELANDTVLLESGLDSLGFATLVAELEEELGYDPFVMMDEPIYPTTFGEFVELYETYKDEKN
ncbi:acyl carrier protein [Gracilimonas mengyeensis]|uniref:Phosphopantetheine attachment site n=1 Tax=Gracilimonas mengyeensis TaxID=1302730 RepID=A0A521FI78_9BACT|nr:acyl carrier protein [Gracilimonas mengyeensis]SMO95913.1 Phosphopantetheine attachment site [Gracilimonas mengyeensis]